jgi:hypothetical protein
VTRTMSIKVMAAAAAVILGTAASAFANSSTLLTGARVTANAQLSADVVGFESYVTFQDPTSGQVVEVCVAGCDTPIAVNELDLTVVLSAGDPRFDALESLLTDGTNWALGGKLRTVNADGTAHSGSGAGMRVVGSSLFNRVLDRIVIRIVVTAEQSEGKVASALLLETYGQATPVGSCREVRLAGAVSFDGSHAGTVEFGLGTTTRASAALQSRFGEWPRPTPTPVKNGIGFTIVDVAGLGSLQTYDHFVQTTAERATPADDIYIIGRVNGGSGAFSGAKGEIVYRVKRESYNVAKWEGRGQVCR